MRFLSSLFLCWVVPFAAFGQPEHVIVIGVDGLGGSAIRDAATPRIHELMARGSWTLNARAVIPTVSSPNWASMIMGATPAHHGITSNEWMPDKFDLGPVGKGPSGLFPTVVFQLREAKPKMRIGIIHDWADFGRLVEPGVVDLIEHVKGSAAAADRAISWWRETKPDLLFLHLDDVDHTGHEKGWWTQPYFAEVTRIDGLIGRVIDAVKEAGIESSTVILVTADHGGQGKSHGGLSSAHVEIPWIIAGPGVPKGRELQRVDTFDTAPTLAKLFRVKAHACWIGKAVI